MPDPAAPAVPVVGDAEALHALQEIPLPQLASQTQPTVKTLVNFDTIFYVEAAQFQRTVTLLGQQVTLDIRPSRFVWSYGDGSVQTTTTPGAKYPAKEIVHRYPKAHLDVAHSVAITWTARYRVGAGPWQDVPGTVTSQGPATTLHISEATPVLTG
ncbi:MAG: hypothetical protein JWO46_3222 [Nocardioidaceae bacterium]|nr:hypothetical protein [Nocardioidaceae bacterium]